MWLILGTKSISNMVLGISTTIVVNACINGSIGLRVPSSVKMDTVQNTCERETPFIQTQRVNDDAYSIVAQYQAEYRGIVQYYRMAYNLHTLGKLRRTMELSLVKTMAKKYKQFFTLLKNLQAIRDLVITTQGSTYKVLQVVVKKEAREEPSNKLTLGVVPLRWNKWVALTMTIVIAESGASGVN